MHSITLSQRHLGEPLLSVFMLLIAHDINLDFIDFIISASIFYSNHFFFTQKKIKIKVL